MELVAVVLFLIAGHCFFQTDAVTVSTQYGQVRGFTVSYPNATGPVKSVRRFLGIPFASPPLNELRFKAPEPPKSWNPSTYDARYYRNVCIQVEYFTAAIQAFWPNFTKADYSEDCLYLNVFTPGETGSGPFPVMVYIHGGGYVFGTPVLSPSDQIALRGVVVVTIQYRLGPFGFLSTGDSAAPGNFGMLDQVQALKWVKENIKRFGGDPNMVTIFGLSAGSASVALQLLSPLSKGLFHRAISESGVELSTRAFHKTSNAVFYTKFLANTVGCGTDNSESIVECLRSKPAVLLNNKGGMALSLNKFLDIPWSPVADGRFLPDTPMAIRKAGTFHKVPYMAGFTSHEGSSFLNMTINAMSGVDPVAFKKYLETYSQRRVTDKRTAAVLSNALQFEYTPWPDASNRVLLRQELVDFMTNVDYVAPTTAVLSSHSSTAPSFMFLFSHRSKLDKRPSWMGAKHSDSKSYIFGFPFMNLNKFDEADRNVSRFMMKTWTNFAKIGDPTPEPVDGVKWSRFNSSNLAYLDIAGSIPKMARNYRPRNIAFWNWYFPKLLNIKFDGEKPTLGSHATSVATSCGTLATLLIVLFLVDAFCAVSF